MTQSTYLHSVCTVYVPSLEFGPPTPSPGSECAPPPGIKGGGGKLAGG
jgi:hypothetical protein